MGSETENRVRRRFDVAAGIGVIPILAALVSVPLAIFSIRAARDRSSGPWPLRLICLAAVDLLGVVCAIYLMHSGIRAQRQPVQRARIGIAAAPAQDGVGVQRTYPGLPAEKAGIQSGDVILAVDGTPVGSQEELIEEISREPDRERELSVRRGDSTLAIRIEPVAVARPALFEVRPSTPVGGVAPWWIAQLVVTAMALLALALRARARAIPAFPSALVVISLALYWSAYLVMKRAMDWFVGGHSAGGWLVALIVATACSLIFSVLSVRVCVRRGVVPAPHWQPPQIAMVGHGLLYAVGLGGRALLLGHAAWNATGLVRWSPASNPWAEATSGLPPMGLFLFELVAVVLGPLAEELLYRGVLLPWLERLLSSRTALAVSAAIFAVQHLAYGPGVAAVFVTALVLGWARQRTGGLAAPLFIHTAYNGVSALVRAWRYN